MFGSHIRNQMSRASSTFATGGVVIRMFSETASSSHLPPEKIPKVPKGRRFRSDRTKLSRFGVDALLPHARPKYPDISPDIPVASLPTKERVWIPPAISNRRRNVLRKMAILEGTYGKYDPATGVGWDPEWDLTLAKSNPKGLGRYTQIRKPKLTARQRSRESRALKIEEQMKDMDARMEELQAQRHKNKPVMTMERKIKEAMKVKK
jgi:hypothetical protein